MSDEFPEYTEHVGACKDCGNSPVNHFSTKVVATIDVLIGTFAKRFSESLIIRPLNRFAIHFANGVVSLAAKILGAIGIATYAHDPQKAVSYRSRVIWEEAVRRNIEMEQMVIGGKRTDTYRAKIRGGWFYFESLPIPPEAETSSVHWLSDKILLKQELQKNSIAVPRFKSVTNFTEAEAFLLELNASVVVKPRVGTRGRHTTVSIHTKQELAEAVRNAKVLCAFVAVEEELRGSVCRGTVVGAKLVGFFQADPAIVVGDGTSTLHTLIDHANEMREKRIAKIELTDESTAYLQRNGYTLESIPAAGTHISIGHRTGRLFGGKTRELLHTVHPRLKEDLEKAARVLNTAAVGFDVVIADPEKDPDTQKWGIIEANTLPFIDLHYLPLTGEPSNPAAAIWDLWKLHQK